MRSGKLDRRITLQRKTITTNTYGEEVETWGDIATAWAEMLPVRGSERYASQQTVAEADVKWRIRYREKLTPINRLTYKGRIYDVNGVLEIGRRVALEIYSKARAE